MVSADSHTRLGSRQGLSSYSLSVSCCIVNEWLKVWHTRDKTRRRWVGESFQEFFVNEDAGCAGSYVFKSDTRNAPSRKMSYLTSPPPLLLTPRSLSLSLSLSSSPPYNNNVQSPVVRSCKCACLQNLTARWRMGCHVSKSLSRWF